MSQRNENYRRRRNSSARTSLRLGGFSTLLVLFPILACSKPPSLLVPVHGQVTMDGTPLTKVSVYFRPVGETRGNGALGGVDAGGRFELIDVRGEKGAYVGEYVVTLYPAPAAGPSDDPRDVVSMGNGTLPMIYINPEETPLRATIPPRGGTVDIMLTTTGDGATTKTTSNNDE